MMTLVGSAPDIATLLPLSTGIIDVKTLFASRGKVKSSLTTT